MGASPFHHRQEARTHARQAVPRTGSSLSEEVAKRFVVQQLLGASIGRWRREWTTSGFERPINQLQHAARSRRSRRVAGSIDRQQAITSHIGCCLLAANVTNLIGEVPKYRRIRVRHLRPRTVRVVRVYGPHFRPATKADYVTHVRAVHTSQLLCRTSVYMFALDRTSRTYIRARHSM
jgi:hypothetical protein